VESLLHKIIIKWNNFIQCLGLYFKYKENYFRLFLSRKFHGKVNFWLLQIFCWNIFFFQKYFMPFFVAFCFAKNHLEHSTKILTNNRMIQDFNTLKSNSKFVQSPNKGSLRVWTGSLVSQVPGFSFSLSFSNSTLLFCSFVDRLTTLAALMWRFWPMIGVLSWTFKP